MSKLVCKKEFNVGSENYFSIGKYYDVYSEDDDGFWVITHLVYQDKGCGMVEKFYKTKPINNYRYLYDYFYTEKEYRKLKLKRLNEEIFYHGNSRYE
jgi:hypothetical protein